MKNTIFLIVSLLIAAFAFAFGAIALFRKRKPLYFQLLIAAAGCFALTELSSVVNTVCGETDSPVNIGLLGIFGCNFFLLSANYGQLDRIVDDGGKQNLFSKRIAVLAPLVALGGEVAVWFARRDDLFFVIVLLIVLFPAIPASYFNLKHLLMPVDDFGFLRATRFCNLAALIFIAASFLGNIFLPGSIPGNIASVFASVSVLGLVLAARKGAKAWAV